MGQTAENLHDAFPQLTKESRRRVRGRIPAPGRQAPGTTASWTRSSFRCPSSRDEGWTLADRDEFLRPDTTLEALATLRTPFRAGGRVTAGNSAGLTDGATAALDRFRGRRTASSASSRRCASSASPTPGVEPELMGLGPVPATKRVLERAGLDDRRRRPLRAERALRRSGAHVVRRRRRRSRRSAPESLRRSDRMRAPARGDRRAADGAARPWIPRPPRLALRADGALHRARHGRSARSGRTSRTVASSPTEFKLQRLDTRVGPIALVTMDNGEDWQKPNTFGEAALRSLEGVLDRLRSRDWRGLLLTGKPFVFAVGADIDEFGEITPERARLGGQAGHELFGRIRELPVRHGRGDQRRRARRRRRDRAALRLPHDLVLGAALRLPRGLPRPHPRLGRDAARPAARRRRAGGDVHRREPAPPEPDARRAAGVRRRVRGRAASSPVEFLDESLAFLLDKVEEGAGKRRPAADLSDVVEVCRKARARLDGQVHGATPAPYRALDLIEGAAAWSLEEGYRAEEDALAELLPGPQAQASVYAFDLVERRAKRGVGMPDAEPRRVQRVGDRRRGAHGAAARAPLPAPARGPGRAPRPHAGAGRRGDRLDPATSSPSSSAAAGSARARRGSSARSSPEAPAGESSPAATSCSRRSSRRWPSRRRSSPSSSASSPPSASSRRTRRRSR